MSKTIVVTGAASPYGRAIIQTLAGEGHGVVAVVDPLNEANSVAAKELQQTANVELIEVDVRNDESVNKGFSFILKRYGHVDVLVNNEGPARMGLTENTEIEHYQEVYNTNVYGVLRSFKAVLPTMRKNQGGLLINVNSGVSYFALPFVTAHTMAKAGLELLTEGILAEVRRFGIESVGIWTGYYPMELLNDSIIKEIDIRDNDQAMMEVQLKHEASVHEKDKLGKQHAQVVADLVLEIINMKEGTRPLRFSMNPRLSEAENHYAKARSLASEAWNTTYGV